MTTEEIKYLESQYHLQTYNRMDIVMSHGVGSLIYDTDGKEYIDCLSGIAVNSLGHSHPALINAIAEQSKKLMHISNYYYSEPQSKLAELLVKESRLNRAFFCNSGAEAMEGALKIARKYASVNHLSGDIVSLENCFHGRTIATISMGKEKYQNGFGPLPTGFAKVAFNDIEGLRKKFESGVIAVVIEPIQGEGGIHTVSHEFMLEARKLCDEHNALLIIDEIQCGIGRSGTMFAYDNHGIKPDILTLAKALGSGFPIGAFLVSQKLENVINKGEHGSTFGGNPLACAVAYSAFTTIKNENLPQQAKEKGNYFKEKLQDALSGMEDVKDIRVQGLLIGVELNYECANVVRLLASNGALASCTANNTIRILPPLIITYSEIDKFIEILKNTIIEYSAK